MKGLHIYIEASAPRTGFGSVPSPKIEVSLDCDDTGDMTVERLLDLVRFSVSSGVVAAKDLKTT